MKLLIIGGARHGKDNVAEMIEKNFGLKPTSSSKAALDLFLFDVLNDKYEKGYKTKEEAFADRVSDENRKIWYDEIVDYNKENPSRLAMAILRDSDIYVGMRSRREYIDSVITKGLFDYVIGVKNPKIPEEQISSNTLSVDVADHIILNDGTLEELESKVVRLMKTIKEI